MATSSTPHHHHNHLKAHSHPETLPPHPHGQDAQRRQESQIQPLLRCAPGLLQVQLHHCQVFRDFPPTLHHHQRVLKFFVTVIICVHIMGCFWYYAAKINNFEEGTWVYELGLSEQSPAELYITSVYWAVATIATVGFGDIHAFNELEQLIAIFWMIFGVGFYSFTVGSLSTLLSSLDTRSSHLQNKITFMDEFCQDTKLPKSLKDKIRRVLEYNSLVNIFSQTERDDFLLDIPLFLKFQIAQAMYAGLKERVPFFKNKDPVFISTFIPKLKPFKLQLGEFVYQKGEYPNLGIANQKAQKEPVYFIICGRINMVIGVHNVTFKTYTAGSYFGEIEIFDNSSRLHSARAEVDTDLLCVEQDVFKHLLESFKEYKEEVRLTSLEKLRRERESISKLQELIGLSSNSNFFLKKRTQSIYRSVKLRQPVQMIEIQDSDERKQGLNSKDEQESQLLTKEGEFIVTSKDDVIEEDQMKDNSLEEEEQKVHPEITCFDANGNRIGSKVIDQLMLTQQAQARQIGQMEVVLGRILGELEARKANESKVRFGNKAIKFSFPMPMPERPKFSLDPGMLET